MDDQLNYIDKLISILDKKTKDLRNKTVVMVNVQWKHRKGLEWTWEPEVEMGEQYTEFFAVMDFEDKV